MSKSLVSIIKPSSLKVALENASGARVVPVDATWFMPNNPRNAYDEYQQKRIGNAVFFDLDKTSLPGSKYPHMLPTYEGFTNAVKKLGITVNDRLVVYDKSGIFSSPRVAWTFALFGHKNVQLLNSYTSYEKAGLSLQESQPQPPIESESYKPISPDQYAENYKNEVIEYQELLDLVKSGRLGEDYISFDARPNDRFTGKAPEPRPGLSSGHVPFALSLPFSKVVDSTTGTYKSREELLKVFKEDFGLDLTSSDFLKGKKGIIVSCGSGVTAVVLKLAINSIIGLDVPIRVYDGSWTEWASRAPEEYIVKDEN